MLWGCWTLLGFVLFISGLIIYAFGLIVCCLIVIGLVLMLMSFACGLDALLFWLRSSWWVW